MLILYVYNFHGGILSIPILPLAMASITHLQDPRRKRRKSERSSSSLQERTNKCGEIQEISIDFNGTFLFWMLMVHEFYTTYFRIL